MGSYSGNYVCVPLKNNYWWIPVVFIQFLIVLCGLLSHFVFIRLAINSNKFGIYTRITFLFISLCMVDMLITSTGAFLFTIFNKKLIEDCEISAIEARKWLLYIHSFGEYFFVVAEFLGTMERVASTIYPKLRKSLIFPKVFTFLCIFGAAVSVGYIWGIRISFQTFYFVLGFGSLSCLELLNGIIVFALFFQAKKMYKKKKGAPLNHRFEFSRSYDYSKCAAVSVIFRILLYSYVWGKLAGLIGTEKDEAFYYFMNVFINLYCFVYPWAIMLTHRMIKKEIFKYLDNNFPFIRRNATKQDTKILSLYTIDGHEMNHLSTYNSHFDQLAASWGDSRLHEPVPLIPATVTEESHSK